MVDQLGFSRPAEISVEVRVVEAEWCGGDAVWTSLAVQQPSLGVTMSALEGNVLTDPFIPTYRQTEVGRCFRLATRLRESLTSAYGVVEPPFFSRVLYFPSPVFF